MTDAGPPPLPKDPELPPASPKRRIAPRILLGCSIAAAIILALVAGSMVFFFATAKKGHDRTTAEYAAFFETHRDCFRRLAELEDAGEDSTSAPCVKDLDAVSLRSKPLTVTMYLFFNADLRSFVYQPNQEPAPLVKDLDAARRESPGGGSAYVALGEGWYLRYMWD